MRSALVRTDRYTRTAIVLHWTIAALVLVNLWLGLGHDSLPKDWAVMPVHKAVGITILALTLVRIGWRLAHPAPPLPVTLRPWERAAALTSHVLLYAFLLVMPLSGWAMVSGSKRRPLEWFGAFDIPYLPVSDAVAGAGHEVHELLGWGMVALLVVHVAAALRHHFLLRDNVLARMVPGLAARGGAGENSVSP